MPVLSAELELRQQSVHTKWVWLYRFVEYKNALEKYFYTKFYKVHFRASILARLSYQKSLKKLDWRVISK